MKNKFHTLNISTNYSSKRSIYPNYSSQRVNRKKTKKIKSFSPSTNNSTIFDPYEEYVSKLEYYNPDLMKGGKDDPSPSGNTSEFNYLRLIIEISVAVIFAAIAFFVAKKIYEQRKKRANELTDDDFDYTTKNEEKEKPETNNGFGIN